MRPVVVAIEGECPLQRRGGLVQPFHAELCQAELVQVIRRIVGIQPDRALDLFERLARPAREAQRVRQRNVAIRIIGIAGDRSLRFGDGFVVLLRVQEHSAGDLMRERRRVAHGLRQELFCLEVGLSAGG